MGKSEIKVFTGKSAVGQFTEMVGGLSDEAKIALSKGETILGRTTRTPLGVPTKVEVVIQRHRATREGQNSTDKPTPRWEIPEGFTDKDGCFDSDGIWILNGT